MRDAQIQITTNPMHDFNFGMFRGQRSTLGNGLSGEPLKAACHHFALPTTWRSTTAQGSRMRYSQCENAPLVLSSLYLPAGQFNHHKAKSGALQGWEDQRCSPANRLRFTQESCGEQVVLPFRIRVHPFEKISQWAIRWFQGLLTLIWVIDSLTFPSMPFFCLENVPTNLKQRSFHLSTQSLNSA